MRGSKAKALRQQVYGKGKYSGPVDREYVKTNKRNKRVQLERGGDYITITTNTILARGNRLKYQLLKKVSRYLQVV